MVILAKKTVQAVTERNFWPNLNRTLEKVDQGSVDASINKAFKNTLIQF